MLLEVNFIEVSIRSEKKQVIEFLSELHGIMNKDGFNIRKQFVFIKSSKEEMMYSTRYALVDLDYDDFDVIDRLRELTVSDYSETLFDKDDDKPPLLFVFGKTIEGKEVYIKLKIKGEENKKILCVSFHYAKYKMNHPYA